MEKFKKSVIYIGTDDVYLTEINSVFCKDEDSLLHLTELESTSLLGAIIEVIPNVILIEVTEFIENEEEAEKLLHILKQLKNTQSIGSVALIAIFSTIEERDQYEYLFSTGFNYGIVKSEDISPFNDISYIIGSEDFNFPTFAKANLPFIKYTAKMQIDIERIDTTNITAATDIELDEYEGEISFNIFEDYTVTEYEQIRKEGDSFSSSNLYSYGLKIPYAGPFDEITETSIFPSTIETWLELNKARFSSLRCTVMVISKDITQSLLTTQLQDKYNIDTFYLRKLNEERNAIIEVLPDIIISEFDSSSDHSLNTQYIIETIKSIEAYHPMVVTFKNPSSSEATQKAFAYHNMMSVSNNINNELIDKLIEIYQKSEKWTYCEEVIRLKELDARRLGFVDLEIEVTSFTEREITFTSKREIPYFSNVRFDEPSKIYAIIVPSYRELESFSNKYHYIAIIHSYSHHDKQLLRRFVNQSIFSPPEEFKYVPQKIEVEEGYFEAPEEEDEEQKVEVDKKKIIAEKLDNNVREIRGKSKL